MIRQASCACGSLTVTCKTEPLRVSICHCLACKQRTGSAFSWNARFDRSAVEVSGPFNSYTRIGDEGSEITYHFCPTCGVAVFYENSEMPESVMVQAGTFADPAFPAPEVSVYHAPDRHVPWLEITARPLRVID